jgi:short-subunit dehydrogenase
MATRNVLITGASSGIGAALARACAAKGTRLFLWGRDGVRLNDVAEACRAAGAAVETHRLDLRDVAATAAEIRATFARYPLDLAILNAGLGGAAAKDRAAESYERAHDMAVVNFVSPVVSATILSDLMAERGKGHIVLMSSIAGSFPLPQAPTYSGTKAGLDMFAEALERRMARHGVSVTLLTPGFIDTPMSQSVTSPKPFLMSADNAARIMVAKIAKGRRRVVVPWHYTVLRGLSRLVPRPISRLIMRRY